MLADQRHDVQGTDFGGTRGVLYAHLAPHDATELDLAIPAGYDPRRVEQLAHLLNGNIRRECPRRLWKLQAERAERCLRRIHVQHPPRPGGEQGRSTSWARLKRAVATRVATPIRTRPTAQEHGWIPA